MGFVVLLFFLFHLIRSLGNAIHYFKICLIYCSLSFNLVFFFSYYKTLAHMYSYTFFCTRLLPFISHSCLSPRITHILCIYIYTRVLAKYHTASSSFFLYRKGCRWIDVIKIKNKPIYNKHTGKK